MKTIPLIFTLALLATGSIVAHEKDASSATTEGLSITDQTHHIFERVIDERLIDRLGLFDHPNEASRRYDISLNLEKEDSAWNFEVTITMEF